MERQYEVECGGGRVETLTNVGDTEKWMGMVGR